jgi:hypothetical protein
LEIVRVYIVQNLLSGFERKDPVSLLAQQPCMPVHLRRIFVGTFENGMSCSSVPEIADRSIPGQLEAGGEPTSGLLFNLFTCVKLLIARVTLNTDASWRATTPWGCSVLDTAPTFPKLLVSYDLSYANDGLCIATFPSARDAVTQVF